MTHSKENHDLNFISNDQMIDRYIGEKGNPKRDDFEVKLSIDKLAETIKELRKKQNLTQSELGERVGVKKSQISKIENSTLNIGLYTVYKVFRALNADVTFKVNNEVTFEVHNDKEVNLSL